MPKRWEKIGWGHRILYVTPFCKEEKVAELFVDCEADYNWCFSSKLLQADGECLGKSFVSAKADLERLIRPKLFWKIMNSPEKHLVSPECMDWLVARGYFNVAASTKYHGNYEGGLFEHSLAVSEQLIRFTDVLGLKWKRPESPLIIGMFHDLCKIDQYVPQFSDNGALAGFDYNNDMILKGHGEKSVMLLSQFMTLTEEEILCIRFHMGAYETEQWNEWDAAIKKYETVLWTHTADMYASKVNRC